MLLSPFVPLSPSPTCVCKSVLYIYVSITSLQMDSSIPFFEISLLFFSRWVVSNLRPQRLQHARLPCPSPSPRACSNSCPLSWWCHATISPSFVSFSSCLQSFPASGSFPVSRLCTPGAKSIGASASASVLPMNVYNWFPLGLTSLISLQSKGLSRFHIYALIYNICFFLSDLLHSVKQALGSSTSLELTQICSFVWLSNIPLFICTHLLYPFICRWTSRLLPCPGYCK